MSTDVIAATGVNGEKVALFLDPLGQSWRVHFVSVFPDGINGEWRINAFKTFETKREAVAFMKHLDATGVTELHEILIGFLEKEKEAREDRRAREAAISKILHPKPLDT